jgi:hypothetical protein
MSADQTCTSVRQYALCSSGAPHCIRVYQVHHVFYLCFILSVPFIIIYYFIFLNLIYTVHMVITCISCVLSYLPAGQQGGGADPPTRTLLVSVQPLHCTHFYHVYIMCFIFVLSYQANKEEVRPALEQVMKAQADGSGAVARVSEAVAEVAARLEELETSALGGTSPSRNVSCIPQHTL